VHGHCSRRRRPHPVPWDNGPIRCRLRSRFNSKTYFPWASRPRVSTRVTFTGTEFPCLLGAEAPVAAPATIPRLISCGIRWIAKMLDNTRKLVGLLQATCPILRSPTAMGNGPNCDYRFLLRIVMEKGNRQSRNRLVLFLSNGQRSGLHGLCQQLDAVLR